MKLRPHPGTTILFCAIKENPRRKNCRARLGLMRAGRRWSRRRPAARGKVAGAWAVAPGQHEQEAGL
ncbi:hypothetical protein CUJ90_01145 [Paraburkholderia terricola]|nr:hypothetical protein CUJ90_01145 [Paraburkholderia terricola]